jgi:NADP-dependent 3-hydroxy acid dehydrogenase YdfG
MKEKDIPELYRPVVWITGASSGIGIETAKQFAQLGCKVCVSARRKKYLDVLVKEIIGFGGHAYSFPFDITNPAEIQKVSKQITKQYGRVDVLINNAGITSFKPISETSIKEIDVILKTNLLGHIACAKSVLPSMIKQKSGSIFNIISMVAQKTYENSGAYTASKSGMLGFGKVLREEMRNHNIKVINIIPGATNTEIWNKKIREKYSDRMMKAKSVAEAILSVYQMPDDVVVDEMVVRPITGDLN